MSSIFELTKQQQELYSKVTDGTFTEEDIQDTLEGVQHEINEKIGNYCHVINLMQSQELEIKNEIERLNKLKTQKQNEIKRIKNTLKIALSNAEIQKFDTGLYKGHLRSGSKSVNIINVDDLPDNLVKTKVSYQPNKTEIKTALLAGETVKGAELVTGESSIVIS